MSGFSSSNFILLTILEAASFCLIAIAIPDPPAPERPNKGIAKGPVKAIPREGNKLGMDPATHLPASLMLPISSTAIALWKFSISFCILPPNETKPKFCSTWVDNLTPPAIFAKALGSLSKANCAMLYITSVPIDFVAVTSWATLSKFLLKSSIA